MPAIGFKYPEGDKILFEDVVKYIDSRGVEDKLDIERMGMYPPALIEMMKVRENDRKPSVTELLNGTCQAYLERTRDFYIDPQQQAFSLLGTLHHHRLEDNASGDMMPELELELWGITGIVDLYDSKTKNLVDYKSTGSYKASKVLGIDFYLADDPSGEVYKRAGKWGKKGEPKKVRRYWKNPEKADLGDWTWQINMYRLMLQSQGKKVHNMYVQMIVRDGGVAASRDRGIDRNIYLIEVPFIHDDHLKEKFTKKRDLLLEALESREIPDKCSDSETWGGKKCESFCPVREHCPYVSPVTEI
tara:strand:+ start:1878 stop:2783 length:906 start_codon:yes stop_codon:yes gene_type:complete